MRGGLDPRARTALLAIALAAAASCRGERSTVRPSPAGAQRAATIPLEENERGVVGAPVDETEFEFEPEPDEPGPPILLDGTPEIPAAVRDRLAPYLDSRRTRLAGVGRGGRSMLVLSRIGATTQAFTVDAPLGPLTPVTAEPEPIEQVAYLSSAGGALLFRSDLGGDERFQIFRLDLASQQREVLSDGRSHHGPFALASRSGLLAFTSSGARESDTRIHVVPAAGASPRQVVEREGQWIVGPWSADGERLVAREYRTPEDSALYLLRPDSGEMTEVVSGGGPAIHRDGRFGEGDLFYFVSNRDGDVLSLYELDLASGALEQLTADIPWDVEAVAVSGSLVAFASNEDGASALRVFDRRTRQIRRLAGLPAGLISGLRFAAGGASLVMTISTATEPADVYAYDLASGALVRWTASHLADPDRLIAPQLVRVPSFDGLEVPVYYYRPPGEGPFPVLLWIHGGPEDQTRLEFHPIIQYFAVERGVAVLAPNVRGSDGYGRRFRSLDDGRLRLDAVRDVGAVLDFVSARPELDAGRVGIYGASYGGFVVLASLIEFGERIVAGCDMVGMSNLVSFLEATSARRQALRRPEYGDERDPEMRAYLTSISPLTRADQIRSALFVAHGANDPRVPVAEAEQIVRAVRAGGNEVWYMLAQDEGHRFTHRRSRDLFYQLMATFFEEHLQLGLAGEASSGEAAESEPRAGEGGADDL